MPTSVIHDTRWCLLAPAVTAEQIKAFRKELNLTQEEFAIEFNVPVATLRDWEQATRPSRASALFAELVELKLPAIKSSIAAKGTKLQQLRLG